MNLDSTLNDVCQIHCNTGLKIRKNGNVHALQTTLQILQHLVFTRITEKKNI